MRHSLSLFALLALAACSDGGGASIDVPSFGTEYVFFAAAGGRPLTPGDVRVVLATELKTFEVPGTGTLPVEVLVGGVSPDALPDGLDPSSIEFVSKTADTRRPVPPLVDPRIFSEPVPAGQIGVLVPLDEPGLSEEERDSRKARIDKLFENLAIKDPCRPLDVAVPLKIPRTQAESLGQMQILSNGDIAIALSATSTAIFGLLVEGDTKLREVPVDTGTTADTRIQPGERATIEGSSGEIERPDGLHLPAAFALTRGGALGHVGVWDRARRRFVDETPRTLERSMGPLGGVVELPVDGEDAICSFGAVANTCRSGAGVCEGGAWCRTKTSTVWRTIGFAEKSVAFTGLVAVDGFPLLATSFVGSIVSDRGRDRAWREIARPAGNQNPDCVIGCVSIPEMAVPPTSSADLRAVVAGADAQYYRLTGATSGDLLLERLDVVDHALFGDERTGGARAFEATAIGFDPDGGLWIGTPYQRLIRVSPDRSRADRVCLPDATEGMSVSGLAFRPNGRLVVGFRPSAFVVGSWQTP